MADIVTPLLQTFQRQAQLGLTQAQAVDTQALAQMRMFALNQQAQTQQMLQNILGQQATQQAGQPQPNPPGMNGMDPDGPLGPAVAQINALDQQARLYGTLGTSMMAVNPKLGEQYGKLSADIRQHIAGRVLDVTKERTALDKQIGGLAGAAADAAAQGDQSALVGNLRQIAQLNPAALRSIPMQVGPDGLPMPTQQTAQALQNFSMGKMTSAEQDAMKHRVAAEKLAATSEARRAEDAVEARELRKTIADQSAALRREGLSVEQNRLASLDQNRATVNAEKLGNDYERDSKDVREKVPFVQNAIKYLFNEDGTRKPTSQMTAAQDKGLMETYVKIVFPDYKGSVYDKKSVENLTGLPQRFLQGITNLFEGKELPDSVRDDMWKAISSQFKELNAQQIQREENYAQRAKRARVPDDMASAYLQPYALRPTGKAAATATTTLTATNPQTGARMKSTDGGKTWQPM